MMRWALFVHDPDGDMGFGVIVGTFHSSAAAASRRRVIEGTAYQAGYRIEAIVLPVLPGREAAETVIDLVSPTSTNPTI